MSQIKFFKAKLHTPILSTPHFAKVFGGEKGDCLPLDEKGLLRCIEVIALPGTKFEIVQQHSPYIYEVKTKDYKSHAPLFIDIRFVEEVDSTHSERIPHLPSIPEILAYLSKLEKTPYVWGGNCSLGIQELLTFYPPSKPLDNYLQNIWTLRGVDCSGLLYEVSEGFTPRNTSELIEFGFEVSHPFFSFQETLSRIKPLDLIVWKGHVIIVFDTKMAIESREGKGVIYTPLEEGLAFAQMQSKSFSIRRWHPEAFQKKV